MKLSDNFTLEEMIKSNIAKRKHIDNTPNENVIKNLKALAINCLQPIRDYYKKPVTISSGYRCPALNKAVGGVSTSQHCNGMAVDFIINGETVESVFQWCKKNLKYDQLIQEKNAWVHISFNSNGNRHQALRYDGKKYIKEV